MPTLMLFFATRLSLGYGVLFVLCEAFLAKEPLHATVPAGVCVLATVAVGLWLGLRAAKSTEPRKIKVRIDLSSILTALTALVGGVFVARQQALQVALASLAITYSGMVILVSNRFIPEEDLKFPRRDKVGES